MTSFETLLTNSTTTQNGDFSYKSSLSKCLDLYTSLSNNRDIKHLKQLFNEAYAEDHELTLSIILNGYAIRGPSIEKKEGKNHLIGKWLPREKGSEKEIFELLVQRLFTYDYERNRNRAKKRYRKAISNVLKTMTYKFPEIKMAAKEDFSPEYFNTLPSYYRKNHTGKIVKGKMIGNQRYIERVHSENYKKHLESKTKKINTQNGMMSIVGIIKEITKIFFSNFYYHNPFEKLEFNETYELMLQEIYEKTMERINEETNERTDFLVVLDGSGSMFGDMNGVQPIIVGIALSVFFSKMNVNYKDIIIAFSESPSIIKLSGNNWHERLESLISQMNSESFGLNTNFDKMLDLVVNLFDRSNSTKFPSTLIISDMQVDQCDNNYNSNTFIERAKSKIYESYEKKGLDYSNVNVSKLFLLINVNSTFRNKPVLKHDGGIAMLGTTKQTVVEDFLTMNEFINPETSMINALFDYSNWFNPDLNKQELQRETYKLGIQKGGNDERFSGLFLLNEYLKKNHESCHVLKDLHQLGRFKDYHYFILNGDDFVKEYALDYYITIIKEYLDL
jgi:uncharacterized protein with von Willebrand factor type A (vWA) domain